MIAIGVRYLTKYATATNLARQKAEWPPHFGRVFMAMAAAHFESGAEARLRAALEWIESAPPPAIYASDAFERSPVRTYVPANDEAKGILNRSRQERSFPRIRPHEDSVYFIWREPVAPEIRSAMEELCSRVTRVGHSISAAQMWVLDEGAEPSANWLPMDGMAEMRMRVAEPGTLRALEESFNGAAIERYDELADAMARAKGKEKARLRREMQSEFPAGRPVSRRPQLTRWVGYGRPGGAALGAGTVSGPFDEDFVVLGKREGASLGIGSTLQLTGALRNACMKAAGDAPPEWVSGHDAAGAPTRHAHLAFFPLPYVGSEYADGHVMGLGIAIPRDLPDDRLTRDEQLRRYLGPLLFDGETGEEREIELWRKGVWRWTLEREKRERPPLTLQRQSWTKASRAWASVTPVVLHHHPKKRDGDVERIVREAFVLAQYPAPDFVAVGPVSRVTGAGHVREAPPFGEGGEGLCEYQTHVVARFALEVRGPMLVGRGRFRGYGLFKPVSDEEAAEWTS